MQEATNECIDKWNNKSIFLSLFKIKEKKDYSFIITKGYKSEPAKGRDARSYASRRVLKVKRLCPQAVSLSQDIIVYYTKQGRPLSQYSEFSLGLRYVDMID